MKVFIEEQKFKTWVLLLVLLAPLVGGVVPLILSANEIPEFNSEGFWGLTVAIVTILFVLILLLSIKLKTKINEQGIYYQYFPNNFNEKFISWFDIESCYVTKYKSLLKFGGYGYRRCIFGKKGLVMNVGGKFGIQLILKNGKKILIGTQNKSDAEKILITYKSKFTSYEKL